jgi:hypothetical protein
MRAVRDLLRRAVAFGDTWKLARGDVVSKTLLPALILPSLDWFSFPGG